MDELKMSTKGSNGTVTVTVTGELDVFTMAHLRGHLYDVLCGHHKLLILEVTGLSFIDASGLGTLIAVQDRARSQNTELLLSGVSPAMERLLRITKLDGRFSTRPR